MEYARLQGAPNFKLGDASESQCKYALGDAVCVPVVHWLAKNYIVPLISERIGEIGPAMVLLNG